jgi:mono/diheme cytochrome c family protein
MSLRRPAVLLPALAATGAALALSACGSNPVETDQIDQANVRGAQLFARNCGMCHTLDVTGTEGSSIGISDRERVDGPNFNVRQETKDQVLYAIRNGGFSGAIMPENILVGRDAEEVAEFLAKYAGKGENDSNPAGSGQGSTEGS